MEKKYLFVCGDDGQNNERYFGPRTKKCLDDALYFIERNLEYEYIIIVGRKSRPTKISGSRLKLIMKNYLNNQLRNCPKFEKLPIFPTIIVTPHIVWGIYDESIAVKEILKADRIEKLYIMAPWYTYSAFKSVWHTLDCCNVYHIIRIFNPILWIKSLLKEKHYAAA